MTSESSARQAKLARLTILEGRWIYEIYDAAGELLDEIHTSPRGNGLAAKTWVQHSLGDKYQTFPAAPIGPWRRDGSTWETDLQPRVRASHDYRG